MLGLEGCPHGVTIEPYCIKIHVSNKISAEDQTAMERILEGSSRDELYQIRMVGQNNQPQVIGKLNSCWIDQILLAEVQDALARGHPNVSMQIGIWGYPAPSFTGTTGNETKSGHPNFQGKAMGHPNVPQKDWQDAKNLVDKITPILSKYQEK